MVLLLKCVTPELIEFTWDYTFGTDIISSGNAARRLSARFSHFSPSVA